MTKFGLNRFNFDFFNIPTILRQDFEVTTQPNFFLILRVCHRSNYDARLFVNMIKKILQVESSRKN